MWCSATQLLVKINIHLTWTGFSFHASDDLASHYKKMVTIMLCTSVFRHFYILAISRLLETDNISALSESV